MKTTLLKKRKALIFNGLDDFALSRTILIFTIGMLFFQGCAVFQKSATSSITGKIVKEGLIDCFEPNTQTDKGEVVQCETSGVVFYNDQVTMASDKDVPNHSPFFSLTWKSNILSKTPQFLDNQPFTSVKKIEDFSLSPDGNLIVATTGFDRITEKGTKFHPYNALLYWQPNQEAKAQIANPSTVEGVVSSVSLRAGIIKALTEPYMPAPEYFKIEGVALLPQNRLVFGVREVGKDYNNFKYAIKLIQTSYTFEQGTLTLDENFELIYEFDPAEYTELLQPIALSSVEYDRFNERLYLLTSFELGKSDEEIGGYLWTLSMKDLEKKSPPKLIKKADGKPLLFAHKAEGITVLDNKTVFVIHDDDRNLGRTDVTNPETQFSRQPHQAAYSVVEVKN